MVDQTRLGVRFDYDGVIIINGIEYNKYQMQPNAGNDIPVASRIGGRNTGAPIAS